MRISDWSSDVCSSDLAVHALGQRRDEVPGAGRFQRLPRLRLAQARIAQRHVGEHAVVEQDEFLGHVADHAAPGLEVDLAERHAIHQDAPGLRLVEAEQQVRSEEHTSELQSLMRISYAVFCLKKK